MNCPACGKRITKKARNTMAKTHDGREIVGTYTCQACGAMLGHCIKGDFYGLVRPAWHVGDDPPAEKWIYFDLETIGTKIERHHGWCHAETRYILQVG